MLTDNSLGLFAVSEFFALFCEGFAIKGTFPYILSIIVFYSLTELFSSSFSEVHVVVPVPSVFL